MQQQQVNGLLVSHASVTIYLHTLIIGCANPGAEPFSYLFTTGETWSTVLLNALYFDNGDLPVWLLRRQGRNFRSEPKQQ
jgi:hypothetical protein